VGIIKLSRQLCPSTHDPCSTPSWEPLVVGAGSLDVASLLALVADLLTTSRLLGAVTRVVTRLATVVALHAVNTLARHVAVAAARVAGLAGTTETALGTAVATAEAALGAVAGDMAHLTALVALSRAATGATGGTAHGAVAGDVAGLAALVAGLVVLHGLRAVAGHVALVAAVVALGGTLGRAVTGLVARVAARVAGTTTGSRSRVIHFEM